MKNKSSTFFLVMALLMLLNVIVVSASICSAVNEPVTDQGKDDHLPQASVVTNTDAAGKYWKGWQQATLSGTDVQVFVDDDMTTQLDITSVHSGSVIICESRNDICQIRIGSKIGWVSRDALTTVGTPVINNDDAAISEPLSLDGTETAGKLDAIAKEHSCIGVQIAVINDGQISHLYEYGYQNRGSKIPMSPDSKIRVASTSKILVGMGVMSMQDMGILDIDADISTYWGEQISNPNHPDTPITMSSILTHTSSFKDFGYKKRATSALENNLRSPDSFTKHKPGDPAGYRYNNSGICTAGAVAGRAADVNFDRYIREYFYAPLNIDASFHASNIINQDRISTIYSDGTTTIRFEDMLEIPYYGGAGDDYSLYAGGMLISAKDLAKMVCVLIGDGQYDGMFYLKPETVDRMLQRQFSCGDYEQCLILRYREDLFGGGRTLYYHNGNLAGVYSLACFDPETGDGMVVISNGSKPPELEDGVYSVCGDLAAAASELWAG